MNDYAELLNEIESIAGDLRGKTFRAAAEWLIAHSSLLGLMMETGSYRGPSDGHSTLIFAKLAELIDWEFYSLDIDREITNKAESLLTDRMGAHGKTQFVTGDSLATIHNALQLLNAGRGPIRFAYFDSADHDPNNPSRSQRHQLAEVGCTVGLMVPPCAILMDDNIPETGGKTKLSMAFLEDLGWIKKAEGYQLFYVNETGDNFRAFR